MLFDKKLVYGIILVFYNINKCYDVGCFRMNFLKVFVVFGYECVIYYIVSNYYGQFYGNRGELKFFL